MSVSKIGWIILLVLWMAGSTWWHVCQIKQLCADDALTGAPANETVLPATTAAAAAGLTISDGDRFRLELPGNFSFARSGANASMNTLGASLDSLTAYLKNSPGESTPGESTPGRTTTITGYYAADETNQTSFANLGLARAEAIKQYLVQQGIPASSLTTNGAIRSGKDADLIFTPKGDSLYGGIAFVFGGPTPVADTPAAAPATAPRPATEAELAAAEIYSSVFEPIDLYFPLGKANFIKTPETTKFFDEAARYLATHKDKKLRLTGHTDNSGPDATNMRLSRNRANEVKTGLRKSGIGQDQIAVDAKGETAPKVSNDTREGRKANRRVTVVVQ